MSHLLDKARSWYAAAPPRLRRNIGRAVSLLPADWRYGKTFLHTRRDIARAAQDLGFVEQQRLASLRQLVKIASQTPYYQSLFQKVYGGTPDIDHFTFEQLEQLPILTKDDLRRDPQALLSKPLDQLDMVSTSGSSGRPFTFYLDKGRGAREFAYITHIWSQIGFDYRRHTRAMLRGVHLDNADNKPWEYDPALRELRLSPFHLRDDHMATFTTLMERYKVDYIHGYPSSIMVFANYIIRTGWQPPASLKGIFPVSEPTHPHQIARFKEAFPGIRLMKQYGMSEKVLMAGQVGDDPELYDFEPLYGHAELVNHNNHPITTVGETGRIIGTGFTCMGMPFLRYDTEDVAQMVRPTTREHHYRCRLRNIQGRWGEEFVLGSNGELTSMSAINLHSAEYAKVASFQLYQDAPGEVILLIVPQPGYNKADLQPFCDEIQAKTGSNIHFHVKLVFDIPFNTANGKRTFIDQRIDLTPYLRGAAA